MERLLGRTALIIFCASCGCYESSEDPADIGRDIHAVINDSFIPPNSEWISETFTVAGMGHVGEGASVEMHHIDNNEVPEMVLMAYDAPSRSNRFRYRIGWNMEQDGNVEDWSDYIQVEGMGHVGEGAGMAFVNLDHNSEAELILMAYDAPSRQNSFRYRVGWNMNRHGEVDSWSDSIQVNGVGHVGEGADISFTQLDDNTRPEMVLMAYDAPSGQNRFRYRIGWNVQEDGRADSWSDFYSVDGGLEGEGAGMVIDNLDGDPRPDMVLMAQNALPGTNSFLYRVGFNIQENGSPADGWSPLYEIDGVNTAGDGAGIALEDVDLNGVKDVVFMSYDDSRRTNWFRYFVSFHGFPESPNIDSPTIIGADDVSWLGYYCGGGPSVVIIWEEQFGEEPRSDQGWSIERDSMGDFLFPDVLAADHADRFESYYTDRFFPDCNVGEGQTYHYRMRSMDQSGHSIYSEIVTVEVNSLER